MKRMILIFAAIAVIAAVLYTARPKPRYDSAKSETTYLLDVGAWSGTDAHSLQMEAGESLHVEWDLQRGSLDLTVGISGQKPVYTANHIDPQSNPHAAFEITVPQAGEYTVSITAKAAAGSVVVMK